MGKQRQPYSHGHYNDILFVLFVFMTVFVVAPRSVIAHGMKGWKLCSLLRENPNQ